MNTTTLPDAPVAPRTTLIGPTWRFLAETSGHLDSSLDYQTTLSNIVQSVLPRIADYAVVALTAPNGALTRELAAHRHADRTNLVTRLANFWTGLSTTNPWLAEMLCTAEPQIVEFVDHAFLDSAIADDGLRATLRELRLLSLLFLPLVARQRRFGCLMLATTRDSNRRYTSRDVAIANEFGRRAALAIDRSLLYRASEQAARAREEMMAIVSHDLKNPLATIQMAVQFLLEELAPDDRAHEPERAQLKVIHRSVRRMYRLVHDLLDAAAVDAGQFRVAPTPIAVEALVNDAVELLRPLAAAEGIKLIADVEGELPKVVADRERMLQVFSNLGGNALKFTPNGGRLEIRAAVRDETIEFAVSDSGTGIAPHDIPHIFDRYWQSTETTRNGVGLGLAITRGIVQAHGGTIRVESTVGSGTTFRFTLPVLRT